MMKVINTMEDLRKVAGILEEHDMFSSQGEMLHSLIQELQGFRVHLEAQEVPSATIIKLDRILSKYSYANAPR